MAHPKPIVMVILAFLTLIQGSRGFGEELSVFRIGTGGKTGVYYPVGKLIARGITRQFEKKQDPGGPSRPQTPCVIAVAQNSAGSVENVRTILSKEIEAGLVQSDVADQAHGCRGPFSKDPGSDKIRAIASLYSEKFQIVTRKDARIRRIQDLRGKRISLDEQGSGTLSVMRIILDAYRLSETDFSPVYLKPVFTKGKMISGDLHGFVMMGGIPMEAVSDLSGVGIFLVPVPKRISSEINKRHPHLVPGLIPANAYPGVPETPTIQVYAVLAVHADADPDLVYDITAALWSDYMGSLFRQGHPQAREIRLESALTGVTIPLHGGALRFYRDAGLAGTEIPLQ